MTELFEIESSERHVREVIKVVGVGGGGGNALNHIVRNGVRGVEFIAANTDVAHLGLSEADQKIVLGRDLTKGLGAGADPGIGLKAAEESAEELRESLSGADMIFLTAGMGGGTGTGASPIIAKIAKETGALVVAVVTKPFTFEGKRRIAQAEEGIRNLKEEVDALIIIPNDKLLEITDRRTTLSEAFKLADEVLRQAVQGVTDLILRPGFINVDFADVRTVMKDAGTAIMGIGCGDGEDRAIIAAQAAINSPLMDVPIGGASGILFNVTGNDSVGIHEIQEAARVITEAADPDATIIWGHVTDPDIDEDKIVITVIATGFPDNPGKMRSLKAGQRALGIDFVESEIKLASDQKSINVGEVLFESELDIPPIIRKRRKS